MTFDSQTHIVLKIPNWMQHMQDTRLNDENIKRIELKVSWKGQFGYWPADFLPINHPNCFPRKTHCICLLICL